MKFNILDDDGFISIVNIDKYQGFVGDDWQFDQLMEHFVNRMNQHEIIIWASSEDGGGNWNVEVLDQPSEKKEFRHFDSSINVASGLLYFCTYSDLTMVAQFKNQNLPLKHNSHLKININSGFYQVTVRQMFDPENSDFYEDDMTHFEIILKKNNRHIDQRADKVFWWS
jgi:hypothetical protein